MKTKFYWLNPKLEVRKTNKYEKGGKGTFANEKIKKGEIALVIGGYIMTINEEANLPYPENDYGIQISENLVLSTKNIQDAGGINFINHSCNPNIGFNGQIFLLAMRDIEKDEEIVFDYGMALFGSKGIYSYKMKCACGSRECRGIITDNDWKIPKLQKKYKNYFQPYIQDKIKR